MDALPARTLVQISWLVVLAFTCSNSVVSFSAAAENSRVGNMASAFASCWAAITTLVYGMVGTGLALG